MCCFREVDDPRKPSNGTLHDFLEILVIAIAAVLSDCDTIEDIAHWEREKEDWLRQFLVLRNGVASEETFLRIFRALDPKQFEAAFRRWVAGVVGTPRGGLGVDGKTVRNFGDSIPNCSFQHRSAEKGRRVWSVQRCEFEILSLKSPSAMHPNRLRCWLQRPQQGHSQEGQAWLVASSPARPVRRISRN